MALKQFFADRFSNSSFNIPIERVKEHLNDFEYSLFESVISKIPEFKKEEVTLFYPGYGNDALYPLLIVERLAKNARVINMFLVDVDLYDVHFLSLLERLCGKPAFSSWQQPIDRTSVTVNYAHKKLRFHFIKRNAMAYLREEKPNFDFYFERAFDIIRSNDVHWWEDVVALLNRDGVILTDASFVPHPSMPLQHIPINSQWGFYHRAVAYSKKIKLEG